MRMTRLGRLMLRNVVRSRRTLFFSSIGVVVGIATFLFFLSLGFGLRDLLYTKVFPTLPPNEIEVVPEVFATGQRADSHLTDADIEKIRAIPKVVAVHKRLECTFPATAYLELGAARRYFGKALPHMDLFVDGVYADLVRKDPKFFGRKKKFQFNGDDATKPIPVVISNSLYNLYVMSVAPSLKLPVFARQTFLGFRFNVRLGEGITQGRAAKGEIRERFAEIVGFSNYGNSAGVTIPARYLELYNRTYGGSARPRYKSLIVSTRSAEDKVSVSRKLREMKFRPVVDHQAEMVVQIVTTIVLILSVISFVIVVISAVHIMHTFFMLVYERKSEIGLMRAVGASRGDIRLLIVGEAFLLGLLSGAVGLLFGWLFTLVCDWAVVELAPSFSHFRGSSFFAFPSSIVLGSIGFAAVFCALGALLPARQAARMEPAHALTLR